SFAGGFRDRHPGRGCLAGAGSAGAIDTKYWNDRYWVNAELAPLASKGKDNQNWIAVMDAYGGKALRDSFSQAGYIAARVAVRAMLTIKNPDEINRNTVTA